MQTVHITLRSDALPPIANDLVFKSKFHRSLDNCLKFTFQSYMAYKNIYLRDLCKALGIPFSVASPNLYLNVQSNERKTLNKTIFLKACKELNCDLTTLLLIAQAFHEQPPEYNVILFKSETSVTFCKGYLHHFGY